MPTMPFGLTPEEDQALAGLIMCVPGGPVHAGAAILLLLHKYLAGSTASAGPPALEVNKPCELKLRPRVNPT